LFALFFLFTATGQMGVMVDRAADWTVLGSVGGVNFFLSTHLRSLVDYFQEDFYDVFRLLGFFCIGLALVMLVPRERSASFPWVARGVLLDLLVPVLAFSFVLPPLQAVQTDAALHYVPFVALAWTVLTPLAVARFRERRLRAVAWTLYGALAFLVIWPGSIGYRENLPMPEARRGAGGAILRENTPLRARIDSRAERRAGCAVKREGQRPGWTRGR
jgi:hypothetical protein